MARETGHTRLPSSSREAEAHEAEIARANTQTVATVRAGLLDCLVRMVGKDPASALPDDWFKALVYFARGRLAEQELGAGESQLQEDVKVVFYLSMEFLIGRSLRNHLFNLDLESVCREALATLGVELDDIYDREPDAALGNGGLGRLAACFLDSLTTQGYAVQGYGIRYDAGMFTQDIEDGWQVERPETWLRHGNPWEFPRPSISYSVAFGGRLESSSDPDGIPRSRWVDADTIMADAYDLQVSGYRQNLVNHLRLWSARSVHDFDLFHFNDGRHAEAVRSKTETEHLSRVLYPDDSTESGRELRLCQEYFFVSASVQDILERFAQTGTSLRSLTEKVAIQINDTHPALAIPELMRRLIDVRGCGWDEAWSITTSMVAYTNHTLQPEALETWPVEWLERLLPRHLDIIFEINERFLREVRCFAPRNEDLVRRVSIVGEGDERRVRMAHLAIVGSHKVNGVSALHTRIMREDTFKDFDQLFPGRIVCKTNGITSRRWLGQANKGLSELITSRIGDAWITKLDLLEKLLPWAGDRDFQTAFQTVKHGCKCRLATMIQTRIGVRVEVDSLFDVQIKRIHEYKRQLLNVLHVIDRYNRIRRRETSTMVPRTVIFSGKAAAGYYVAKLIIKLIHDVAEIINADPETRNLLKVVFVPDYNVSCAEIIIPAAELSEQISTAGTEASGTGNMKLALNGALTIGTRDGANIQIGEAVGEDNVFFFGLRADDVVGLRSSGGYDPGQLYETQPRLKDALDMIRGGYFSPDDRARFKPIVDSVIQSGDPYMVLADFADYVDTQDRVDESYKNESAWSCRAIINLAKMGPFSADRTTRGYAEEIWGAVPHAVVPSDDVLRRRTDLR